MTNQIELIDILHLCPEIIQNIMVYVPKTEGRNILCEASYTLLNIFDPNYNNSCDHINKLCIIIKTLYNLGYRNTSKTDKYIWNYVKNAQYITDYFQYIPELLCTIPKESVAILFMKFNRFNPCIEFEHNYKYLLETNMLTYDDMYIESPITGCVYRALKHYNIDAKYGLNILHMFGSYHKIRISYIDRYDDAEVHIQNLIFDDIRSINAMMNVCRIDGAFVKYFVEFMINDEQLRNVSNGYEMEQKRNRYGRCTMKNKKKIKLYQNTVKYVEDNYNKTRVIMCPVKYRKLQLICKRNYGKHCLYAQYLRRLYKLINID